MENIDTEALYDFILKSAQEHIAYMLGNGSDEDMVIDDAGPMAYSGTISIESPYEEEYVPLRIGDLPRPVVRVNLTYASIVGATGEDSELPVKMLYSFARDLGEDLADFLVREYG